jgi:hypothetical protein
LEHAKNWLGTAKNYKRLSNKADYMKITNLQVAIGVVGLLGLGGVAQAFIVTEPTDTYVFEATGKSTSIFDGSTITIDKDGFNGVSAFSFVDTALSSTPFTSGAKDEDFIINYGSKGWAGVFNVSIPLEIEPSIAGAGSIERPETVDFTATGISLSEVTLNQPDPLAVGTWTLENPAVSAPDASSTFPMLLGVMAALVGVHYCNRPRLALARR